MNALRLIAILSVLSLVGCLQASHPQPVPEPVHQVDHDEPLTPIPMAERHVDWSVLAQYVAAKLIDTTDDLDLIIHRMVLVHDATPSDYDKYKAAFGDDRRTLTPDDAEKLKRL